jgi:tetratricopeptide (TPR) repeat protein
MLISTIISTALLFATAIDQDGFANRTPPPVSAEAKAAMEVKLKEAQAAYEANPKNAEAIIWLGRRLAYLGRFTDAIETYTKGIALFPADARLYRHRGHRQITLRRFDLAVADLEKAAELVKGKPDEIEPDGQPNARNIPTSTLQFNIWYHLGLAYYLSGQNEKALDAYRECLKVSGSPDRLVATTHWLYMTLRRLDRKAEAAKALEPIAEGMEVIENKSYYQLLLMYKGIIPSERLLDEALREGDSASSHSTLYGIANWHLYNGRREKALEIFQKLLSSKQWTSFGYIAAEVARKSVAHTKSYLKYTVSVT